jgi:hypothetical protein
LNATHGTATKVGTSVVILLFGDVSAQRIQHFAERSKRDTDTATNVRGMNSNTNARGVSGVADGVAEDGRSLPLDDDRNEAFKLDLPARRGVCVVRRHIHGLVPDALVQNVAGYVPGAERGGAGGIRPPIELFPKRRPRSVTREPVRRGSVSVLPVLFRLDRFRARRDA